MTSSDADPACDVAHGRVPTRRNGRVLIAVFASPVAEYLLRYGGDAGFRTVLVEPDERLAQAARAFGGTGKTGNTGETGGTAVNAVVTAVSGSLDETADVVVTDHHRLELGAVLRDALAGTPRWIGVMGNPRVPAPHIPALTALGVQPEDIARVHRPIGLDIGSRTPAEIAIATLAGLIAGRNGRPGGFF